MAVNESRSDNIWAGSNIFTGPTTLPDGVISSAAKIASGIISADRMRDMRRSADVELAATGANIAAVTKLVHIVRGGTGSVVGFEVAITGAATGDRTATVDLQKSTGGGAFASILTSVITIDASTVILTATAATIATPALTDGDILQVVVALGGSAGTQPQGLIATTTFDEYNT